jgi:FkbM family methyltransferase
MFVKLITSKIKTAFILALLKSGFKLTLSTTSLGYKMKFKVSNIFEYYSRFKLPFISEPLLIEWINNYIQPNDCVYDIGSNVGNYSVLIAKKIENKKGLGGIYAFEPNYLNFLKLKENIIINKLDYYINPFLIGLGTNEISYYQENSKNLIGGSGKISFQKNDNCIMSLNIETLLNLKNIHSPNHIKIDIDFNTEKLFEQASFLKIPSLKTIYIEIDHSIKDVITKKFNENNFYLKSTAPASVIDSNYLFIKK